MTILSSETFATELPSGFATIYANINFTATYDAGNEAVTLYVPAVWGAWGLEEVGLKAALSIEIDLEPLSFGANSGFGVLFSPTAFGTAGGDFVTVSMRDSFAEFGRTLSQPWIPQTVDKYVGIGAFGQEVGVRATWRFETYVSGGVRRVAVFRDGVLLWSHGLASIASVVPSVLLYGSSYRIHSVVVTDTPTDVDSVGPATTAAHALVDTLGRKSDEQTNQSAPVSLGMPYLHRSGLRPPGGLGKITGTTKILGVLPAPNEPYASKVRLYEDQGGGLVAETNSDPVTGYYEFLHVAANIRYSTIAYDAAHSFRAVIADNIQPDAMQ